MRNEAAVLRENLCKYRLNNDSCIQEDFIVRYEYSKADMLTVRLA